MNKKKIMQYVAIVLMTGVFTLVGLYISSRIVTPKGEMEKFYDEPKNTIDVIVLGGSHAMASVSPTQIFNEQGITGYNLSSWSQPIWVSYHYFKEALKYQKPKVVLLDVFGAFYDKSYLTGVDVDLVSDDFAGLMKPSLNLLGLNLSRRKSQVTRKTWDEYLNLTKYHTRIGELEKQDFSVIFQDDTTSAKGYGPIYQHESFEDFIIPTSDTTEELYSYAYEYLIKIIELAEKENIKLVLFKAPYITDENDIALLNTIREIATQYNLDFLDFCSENIAELDYAKDIAEHAHINYLGGYKITKYISDYLSSFMLPTDLNEKGKNNWTQASIKEENEIMKMHVKLAKNMEEVLARVSLNKSSIIITKQEKAKLDIEKLNADLKDSLPSELLETIMANDIVIIENGNILIGNEANKWLETANINVFTDNNDEVCIVANGEDYSRKREGFNLAVVDSKKDIYHYFSLSPQHNYTIFTA